MFSREAVVLHVTNLGSYHTAMFILSFYSVYQGMVCFVYYFTGTLSWTKYPESAILDNNLERIRDSTEEECKIACERTASCYSIDFRFSDRLCLRGTITGESGTRDNIR